MCVLSKQTIIRLCKDENTKLIDPWDEHNVSGSSYDLTVGAEYHISSQKDVKIAGLGEAEKFTIAPHKICFVLTEEKVNIPTDVAAAVSLKSEFVQTGLVLSAQPPIDPGYHGKIFAQLHNLSDQSIQLRRGLPFLSIVFYNLDHEVEPYTGQYQNMTSLKALTHLRPFESALKELEVKVEEATSRSQRMLPPLLQAITITVAILALILTILIITGVVRLFGGG